VKLVSIELDYAAASPLILDPRRCRLVANLEGPAGLSLAESQKALTQAITTPLSGPPLAKHVVPGDRVTVAIPGLLLGMVKGLDGLIQQVCDCLQASGVDRGDISLLISPSLNLYNEQLCSQQPLGSVNDDGRHSVHFCAAEGEETAYLLADDDGEPLHLARQLVDADVVVAVESYCCDAAFSGRSPAGELWPSFGRLDRQQSLTRSLLRSCRSSRYAWRALAEKVTFQLGILASLRLVPGRDNTLAGISFGFPKEALGAARQGAHSWRPSSALSGLTIAGISRPNCDFAAVTSAVAAAARTTSSGGTICIASTLTKGPGLVFTRWRQGANLKMLLREAVHSGDPAIVREALQTKLFAQALGDRRLVLLSGLDQDLVEDLDIGHASSPEAIDRLMHQAGSVTLLHEADRLCPKRADGEA